MAFLPHEISLEMNKLISRELELNGVRFDKNAWLSSKNVIQESVLALIPEVHEGRIYSCGILFADSLSELEEMEIIPFMPNQIELAREMSDGNEWFVLYERDHFYGLARFKFPLYNELQLIKNFPLSAGMIIQREASGVTKYFQGDGITIHDNRRWFTKPNIKEAAWKVSQCVGNIDKQILSRILEFAFHLMSPTTRGGGIIVWYLTPRNGKPSRLSSIHLSITNESHSRLLCHLLSQVDGATFLDPEGNLMDTGDRKSTRLNSSH